MRQKPFWPLSAEKKNDQKWSRLPEHVRREIVSVLVKVVVAHHGQSDKTTSSKEDR